MSARSRNRTGTEGLPPQDFKSCASTNFAIRARVAEEARIQKAGGGDERIRTAMKQICNLLPDHSATSPTKENYWKFQMINLPTQKARTNYLVQFGPVGLILLKPLKFPMQHSSKDHQHALHLS